MTEWIISSSVLITAVMLLRSVLRGRISPRIQYALWGIVLLRLLMPFSLFQSGLSIQNLQEEAKEHPQVQQVYQTFTAPIIPGSDGASMDRPTVPDQPVPNQQPNTNPLPQQGTQSTPSASPVHRSVSLGDVLVCIWISGMILIGVCMTGCNLRFSARLKRSRKSLDIPDSLLPVYGTRAVETPCLFGLFHPAVYLTPESAENEQLRSYVLTHELTHYRQFDHVWAVLRAFALVLHWYNPLVWVAFRASRQDGEMACDEGTLRELGEEHRGNYGRTLIGLATGRTFRGTMVTATSMGGTKRAMKERIVILMKNPKTAMMTMVSLILVCALIVGCTFTGAVENPTEPEETTPAETTEPVGITEPTESTTPTETIPQAGIPLTDAQIAQVNEAFNPIISYELDGMTANTVNPITGFFTSHYYSVLELNLAEFLRCFSAYGIVDEPYGDVTEEEFDHLRTLDGFPFPDKENLEDMYVPIHKYPSSVVDAVIFHYSGVHLDQLVEFNGRGDAFYSEEHDAYYNHTSDFGPGTFTCNGGRVFGSYVELYSAEGNMLILMKQNGKYLIQSHTPKNWFYPDELTAEQLQQVNEAFSDAFRVGNGNMQINPLDNFNTSFYTHPSQIDLGRFIYYFGYQGESGNLEADADQLLRKYPELKNRGNHNMTRYPAEAVDEILYKYTGYHIEELYGSRDVQGVYYLSETDAYYSFSSDAGWVGLNFVRGEIHSDGAYVRLFTDIDTELILTQRDGKYYIEAYRPVMWEEPVELKPYEIDQVNKAFASAMEDASGGMIATPISCFFTSYYRYPQQIDLAEFLRNFSAEGIVNNWYENVTEEEFDHIRTLDGFRFPEVTSLEQMHVPTHKYSSATVDAVLYRYTGIHLNTLEGAQGRGDAFYSDKYDAYYNHTSDFGAGIFHCIGGYHYGSYVELYSEDSILCLHRDVNGGYHIYSHLPRE